MLPSKHCKSCSAMSKLRWQMAGQGGLIKVCNSLLKLVTGCSQFNDLLRKYFSVRNEESKLVFNFR